MRWRLRCGTSPDMASAWIPLTLRKAATCSASRFMLTKTMVLRASRRRSRPISKRQLLGVGGEIDALLDPVGGDLLGLDPHQLRIVHVFVGQLHDPMAESGGEQHVEPLGGGRQPAHHIADVLDKTEVEHAVRLVQHHHLDAAETEHALLEIVDDPARRADQEIDAGGELVALLVVVGAAVGQAQGEVRCSGRAVRRPYGSG